MSSQRLFELAFPLAAPFWALMILAPGWSWTRRIARSPLIVLPVLAVYLAAVAPILTRFATEMLNPDPVGVRDLLATAAGTSTVWAQLIAFDLFIGRWMYLDSRDRAIHPLIMSPLLVVTILLSPFGLLTYLAIRSSRPVRRRAVAEPATEPVALDAAQHASQGATA
jgi:hypothetical protein